jgi:predicted transposase
VITIKLKLAEPVDITDYMRQFTSVYRYAYNRFMEGKEQKEVRRLAKGLKNIGLLDSNLIHDAADMAKRLIRDSGNKVVFGGRKNWRDYNKGLISKEEYGKKKLEPVYFRGETNASKKGNRKFRLDMENDQVIFKPNRKTRIVCKVEKTKRNKTLLRLQRLCELGETYFTCRLSNEHVWITFDETVLREKEYRPINKRILAIDLNPNHIGVAVRHGKSIIHKEIIGLKELNRQGTNKKRHEDFEVSKRVAGIAEHYRCEYLAHEKLDMESGDKGKGRRFNKLVNNDWRRRRFVKNLTKRCNIVGIKVQEILPQYSSFMGQIQHEQEYDSVAAAIELSRRCHLFVSYYIDRSMQEVKGNVVGVMRKLSRSSVDRWKKILNAKRLTTYKSLYLEIKKSGHWYRRLFHDEWFSSRMKSGKSCVFIH